MHKQKSKKTAKAINFRIILVGWVIQHGSVSIGREPRNLFVGKSKFFGAEYCAYMQLCLRHFTRGQHTDSFIYMLMSFRGSVSLKQKQLLELAVSNPSINIKYNSQTPSSHIYNFNFSGNCHPD